jgi:hypothetical protein
LAFGAKALRRSGIGDNRLRRRLQNLDTAFAVVRHITAVSSKEFVEELLAALTEKVVEPGGHADSDGKDQELGTHEDFGKEYEVDPRASASALPASPAGGQRQVAGRKEVTSRPGKGVGNSSTGLPRPGMATKQGQEMHERFNVEEDDEAVIEKTTSNVPEPEVQAAGSSQPADDDIDMKRKCALLEAAMGHKEPGRRQQARRLLETRYGYSADDLHEMQQAWDKG